MREVGRAEHASTEQLSALLDGRAEPEEQHFLAGHVDRCVACSTELADLRSVRDLLRALPVYLPPRSFTIPVETARRAPRRFQVLIPLTRALGTVAAVLCVVLFSMDAMQTGYDTAAPAPDSGSAAMHLTRATLESAEAAKPAEPRAAARSADSAPAADAAAKIANAPAPPPAPAAAFAPAPTQVIANAVTATPAGVASKPAESAPRAEAAPQRPAAAAAPPAAQQPVAVASPPLGAPQQAQAAAANPQAGGAPAAPQPTSAAFVPPAPAPTMVPAPVERPAQPSPWLTPIRLWSLGFALVAAALLIGSLVLSRISRTRSGAQDEWTRS